MCYDLWKVSKGPETRDHNQPGETETTLVRDRYERPQSVFLWT